MKKEGYYSSGQFARMAGVTLRTIRYYDKHDILNPSLVTESGARFYTDGDFARLQQILLLKYLGFSLEDIKEMTIEDPDSHFMLNALNIQLKLVQDRIEQMQLVEKAIQNTAEAISKEHTVDWSRMLDLIHLTVMGKKSEKPVSERFQYFCQDQSAQSLCRKSGRLVSLDLPAVPDSGSYADPGTWMRGWRTVGSESEKATVKGTYHPF